MKENQCHGIWMPSFTKFTCGFVIQIRMAKAIYRVDQSWTISKSRCGLYLDLTDLSFPLKDDGYDIADYYEVMSDYGTIDDFKPLSKRRMIVVCG